MRMFLVPAAILGLLFSGTTHAVDYYWDNTSPIETPGFGVAGGTWGSEAKWSTSAAGTDTSGITDPGITNSAFFGTATVGLSAGTVTISGTVSAYEIGFESASGSITLEGGTIQTGAFGFTLNNPSATPTVNCTLTGNNGLYAYAAANNTTLLLMGDNQVTGRTSVGSNDYKATLQLGSTRALNSTTNPIRLYGPGTTLDLNGFAASVGTLEGGGVITDNNSASGTSVFTVNQNTVEHLAGNYSGSLMDGLAGRKLALSYGGIHPLVLSGSGITYTGDTTIRNGVLTLGKAANAKGALGNGSYAGGILNDGELRVAYGIASQTLAGVISGTGSLVMADTTDGKVYLTNANTYSGDTAVGGVGGAQLHAAHPLALQNSTVKGKTARLWFAAGLGGEFTLGGLEGSGAADPSRSLFLEDALDNPIRVNVGNNNRDTVFNHVIEKAGSLKKVGSGILTLGGECTYTGATMVTDGTLKVNGSLATASAVMAEGGTLSGYGTVGDVTVGIGGTLAPGDGVGSMNVRNLTVQVGGAFDIELDGPYYHDSVNASGNIGLDGELSVTLAFEPDEGWAFTIIQNSSDSAVSGAFTKITSNIGFFTATTTGGDGNDVVITYSATPPDLTYAKWIEGYPVDPSKKTELDDADGGGLANLSEFAFMGIPNDAGDDTGARPVVSFDKATQRLSAEFNVRKGTRLRYRVHTTPTLLIPASWIQIWDSKDGVSGTGAVGIVNDVTTHTRVRVSDLFHVGNPNTLYLRIQAWEE